MEDCSDYYPDDFTIELANAVRKSWSAPQETPGQLASISSPMGSPPPRSVYDSSSGSLLSSNNQGSLTSPPSGSSGFIDDSTGDYRLIERHYSLTENTHESITDILIDLDLGSPEDEEPVPEVQPVSIRRGSIQDVQRVRQLLNPRSSFSGVASDEPEVPKQTNTGWVTILADDKPESIKPIIILNRSLQAVNSKYSLHVLHNKFTDATELVACGINTLSFDEDLPELLQATINSRSMLSLFIALVDKFELVCYLSPTCMVMENVDELLDSEEVCSEIDNETCVLLTKESPNGPSKDNLQIVILRPCNEVAMCVKELFTVYGNDDEARRGKFCYKSDSDVLRTLFSDTWGHLSSEEYCVTPDSASADDQTFKIIDYKLLTPWNEPDKNTNNAYCGRWHLAWQQFQHSLREF